MLLQPYGFVRLVADEGAAILPALKYLMKQLEKSPDGLNRIFVNDIILAAYSTVSYTHLDVYKRQPLTQQDCPQSGAHPANTGWLRRSGPKT